MKRDARDRLLDGLVAVLSAARWYFLALLVLFIVTSWVENWGR